MFQSHSFHPKQFVIQKMLQLCWISVKYFNYGNYYSVTWFFHAFLQKKIKASPIGPIQLSSTWCIQTHIKLNFLINLHFGFVTVDVCEERSQSLHVPQSLPNFSMRKPSSPFGGYLLACALANHVATTYRHIFSSSLKLIYKEKHL